MDRAEDLLFVISMVERGALQLLGPLPGDVSLSMLQGATQRLQHAIHMLIGARDQALQASTSFLGGDRAARNSSQHPGGTPGGRFL